MGSDISLSTGAVVAVSGLLSALAGAVGVLFWALHASQNAQIKREQELTNTLLPAVREISQIVLRLAETLQAQGAESRERTERLERLTAEVRDKLLTITSRGRSG